MMVGVRGIIVGGINDEYKCLMKRRECDYQCEGVVVGKWMKIRICS